MFFFAFSLVLHAKYAKSFGACKFPRLVRGCMCVSGVCVCVCLHIMIIVGTSARNRVRSRVINLDTQLCKSRTRLQQQPQQSNSAALELSFYSQLALYCLPCPRLACLSLSSTASSCLSTSFYYILWPLVFVSAAAAAASRCKLQLPLASFIVDARHLV